MAHVTREKLVFAPPARPVHQKTRRLTAGTAHRQPGHCQQLAGHAASWPPTCCPEPAFQQSGPSTLILKRFNRYSLCRMKGPATWCSHKPPFPFPVTPTSPTPQTPAERPHSCPVEKILFKTEKRRKHTQPSGSNSINSGAKNNSAGREQCRRRRGEDQGSFVGCFWSPRLRGGPSASHSRRAE